MELPNIEHFVTALFVLYKEVVLFGKFKIRMNYRELEELCILGPRAVSFVERFIILPLFGRVHYVSFT